MLRHQILWLEYLLSFCISNIQNVLFYNCYNIRQEKKTFKLQPQFVIYSEANQSYMNRFCSGIDGTNILDILVTQLRTDVTLTRHFDTSRIPVFLLSKSGSNCPYFYSFMDDIVLGSSKFNLLLNSDAKFKLN